MNDYVPKIIYFTFKRVAQCEKWAAFATKVNKRQPYIAQKKSHNYSIKVTRFNCISLLDLRAVDEISVLPVRADSFNPIF